MDGDYILLHFDHPLDHPYYLRGHVTKERAQEVLWYEEEITVKAVAHKYGRAVRVGQDHPDAIDGLESVFRVIDTPRRSYYAVTECEPLLPFNAVVNGGTSVSTYR
ncbi:hypothetical protein [Rhodoferax sp.]|uniref:hypothetical protein n=1 Tax=Rhodoferax sp. TaxID=50421 RepID=UPI002755D093|nr:hypothetical protein [Rhodoferax sp.]